jgi:hypothetical protein
MRKPFWALIGFLMFGLGLLSLILALVGLKLTMLNWMYNHGVFSLLIQLFLLFGGIVILYVSRLDADEQ